jgi:alpha-glucosidase
VIDADAAAHAPVGAPATWVLSNHDVTRHVTRYGRADTRFDFDDRGHGRPTDLDLGTRRARAAALLYLALPGSRLPVPGRGARPVGGRGHPGRAAPGPDVARTDGVDPGRDGCRVPLPWSGAEAAVRLQPGTAT